MSEIRYLSAIMSVGNLLSGCWVRQDLGPGFAETLNGILRTDVLGPVDDCAVLHKNNSLKYMILDITLPYCILHHVLGLSCMMTLLRG